MNQPVFKENIDGTERAQEFWDLAELENKTFPSSTGYLVASQQHWTPSVLEISAVHLQRVSYLGWL